MHMTTTAPERPRPKQPNDYPRAVFVLNENLQAETNRRIQAGQSVHNRARTDLERYYALLDEGRKLLARQFTVPELSLIFEVCRAAQLEPHTMKYLPVELQEATDQAQKWKVDILPLAEQVRQLTPCATYALLDAAERFRLPGEDAELDASGAVGLGIIPASR